MSKTTTLEMTPEEAEYLQVLLDRANGRRGRKPEALVSLMEKHQPGPEEPEEVQLGIDASLMVCTVQADVLDLTIEHRQVYIDLEEAVALHKALPAFIKYLEEVEAG